MGRQGAGEGEDVEAELVVGQGEAAFGLWPEGPAVAWASEVMAAADL